MRLILGSASPRRRDLLAQLGLTPDAVTPPDIDETPRKGELPRPYCARLAREKVAAVPGAGPDDVVLCADTTVALGRRILGKPADAQEAAETLAALSGRTHRVLTSVAVAVTVASAKGPAGRVRIEQATQISRVRFAPLSAALIEAYIAGGEPFGKAGSYAVQGALAAHIAHIEGSHSGIMGLPLFETAELLRRAGAPMALGHEAPGRTRR